MTEKNDRMIKEIISIFISLISLFSSSNIGLPQSPAYGAYFSQLYVTLVHPLFTVILILASKLLGQGWNRFKLITTFYTPVELRNGQGVRPQLLVNEDLGCY